jgi:hypothetical protein
LSARKWTPEQRLKQSKAIRRWKPWEQSTGAKSPTGKAISSKNATKTGDSVYARDLIKQVNRILKEQKELIDSCSAIKI